MTNIPRTDRIRRMEERLSGKVVLRFDAHDTRNLPPLNELKAAWDLPLLHEDPLADEERRLLSVAQCCRDYLQKRTLRQGEGETKR